MIMHLALNEEQDERLEQFARLDRVAVGVRLAEHARIQEFAGGHRLRPIRAIDGLVDGNAIARLQETRKRAKSGRRCAKNVRKTARLLVNVRQKAACFDGHVELLVVDHVNEPLFEL